MVLSNHITKILSFYFNENFTVAHMVRYTKFAKILNKIKMGILYKIKELFFFRCILSSADDS